MRRKGLIIIWILALLTGLLVGCGDAPAAREETRGTLPDLIAGTGESWEPGQELDFPSGPDYTLPGANVDESVGFGELPTVTLPEVPETEPPSTVPRESDTPEDFPEPPETEPVPFVPQESDVPEDTKARPDPQLPTDPPKILDHDPQDASPLQDLLEAELEGQEGVWSVYVKNVDTGEELCIFDEPMTAASLIKLFVAGAYYMTDPRAKNQARCAQADVMINASSNDACNALIDFLGKDTINAFIRLSGFEDTVLNRKMLETSDLENYTSARECGQVLEAILLGNYVSDTASERLLENLKQQQRTGKIPAGVPEGVETANKTGELLTVENDVCIVWSEGGTYILCIMSEKLNDPGAARTEIVKLSTLVYDYFTEQPDQTEPTAETGR